MNSSKCLSVFPACAGMFRGFATWGYSPSRFPRMRGDVPPQQPHRQENKRFPRMRGDVPCLLISFKRGIVFSPHARGCSFVVVRCAPWVTVFPACAGMFHSWKPTLSRYYRFPRMRGDVPDSFAELQAAFQFSPHARGCSRVLGCGPDEPFVFPACAGMFLPGGLYRCGGGGFPRMRGDVP